MYQKKNSTVLKHIDFMILDLLVLELSFMLACGVYGGFEHFFSNRYRNLMICVLMLVQLAVSLIGKNYHDILRRGYLIELKKVITQVSLVMAIVFSLLFIGKLQIQYSRGAFILTWMLDILFLYLERVIWKRVAINRLKNSPERPQLLIISDFARAPFCIQRLKEKKYQSFKVAGLIVFDKKIMKPSIDSVPIVADRDEIFEYARSHVVDEVLLNIRVPEETQKLLVQNFLEMGVTVHIHLDFSENDLPNSSVEQLGECTVLTTSINTATAIQVVVKRSMDILGGIVGLMITGVLFLIFAPIIYIQSPGPVFFSQIRVGKNGRKFRIYKFRSMYMDAEERKKELMEQNKMNGLMFKMDDDPRVIPIGKFIRKFSIDEFPQFWNVLKGDMSLVGTRPPTVDEYEQYDPHHKVRLSIKPGLTGMWQVSGRSDITEFEEVVKLDDQYIREWSIRLDIKIIFQTIGVVLGSRGSV